MISSSYSKVMGIVTTLQLIAIVGLYFLGMNIVA